MQICQLYCFLKTLKQPNILELSFHLNVLLENAYCYEHVLLIPMNDGIMLLKSFCNFLSFTLCCFVTSSHALCEQQLQLLLIIPCVQPLHTTHCSPRMALKPSTSRNKCCQEHFAHIPYSVIGSVLGIYIWENNCWTTEFVFLI